MSGENRLAFLDGQRGIAIGLVVCFHAFVRWPALVPYGRLFWDGKFLPNGWVGVQLFFLISGFVINMTLEKCTSFPDFILRRWLRLFPGMLFCSLLVYFSAPLFPERPLGMPTLRDLLPGIFFIEPAWWQAVLGTPHGILEGAFWSIFVEFKFYVVFGLLYFRYGELAAIKALFGLYLLAPAIIFAEHMPMLQSMDLSVLRTIIDSMSFEYLGWFAAGALYYKFYRNRSPSLFFAATACALLAASLPGFTKNVSLLATMAIALFFAASLVSTWVQNALANPVLIAFGFASYPIYLLHENVIVAMIVKLGHAVPEIPPFALPLMPMAVVGLAGWLIAKHVEPWLRNCIKPLINRFRVAFSV